MYSRRSPGKPQVEQPSKLTLFETPQVTLEKKVDFLISLTVTHIKAFQEFKKQFGGKQQDNFELDSIADQMSSVTSAKIPDESPPVLSKTPSETPTVLSKTPNESSPVPSTSPALSYVEIEKPRSATSANQKDTEMIFASRDESESESDSSSDSDSENESITKPSKKNKDSGSDSGSDSNED